MNPDQNAEKVYENLIQNVEKMGEHYMKYLKIDHIDKSLYPSKEYFKEHYFNASDKETFISRLKKLIHKIYTTQDRVDDTKLKNHNLDVNSSVNKKLHQDDDDDVPKTDTLDDTDSTSVT